MIAQLREGVMVSQGGKPWYEHKCARSEWLED